MRSTFFRISPVFAVLILAIFVTLLGCANAHEDPDEAVNRDYRNRLQSFKRRYKAAYVFNLDKHPRPEKAEILGHYPDSLSIRAYHLQSYGHGQRSPTTLTCPTTLLCACIRVSPPHCVPSQVSKAYDVKGMLKAIDSQAKTLTLGPFHPNLIESQPLTVRREHFETFKDLSDWVEANFNDLVALEGLREAASRRQRYKDMQTLAEIATNIPRP